MEHIRLEIEKGDVYTAEAMWSRIFRVVRREKWLMAEKSTK